MVMSYVKESATAFGAVGDAAMNLAGADGQAVVSQGLTYGGVSPVFVVELARPSLERCAAQAVAPARLQCYPCRLRLGYSRRTGTSVAHTGMRMRHSSPHSSCVYAHG